MKKLSILVACGGCVSASLADTVVLQALKDNTLYQDAAGALSNGVGPDLFVGRTDQGLIRRGLVAFDLSSIPPGSTATAATLTLYADRVRAASTPVSLHRASASWGEGASNSSINGGGQGAPAQTGDATWLHRFFPGTLWSTAGGDFVAGSSATATITGNGSYSWAASGMVGDVQGWLNSATTNQGWLLQGNESVDQTAVRFASRENGTANRRPKLTVTFTPPATTGACCLSGNTCVVTSPTQCSAQGGAYQGNGTSCASNPCTPATGACCYPSATCAVVTAAACASGGGVYQGDGIACGAGLCPLVLTPFVDDLPLPGIAQPISGVPGGAAEYRIAIQEVTQQFHRDLPPSRVWGYAGTYPGPTVLAHRGQPVVVTWVNDLRDAQGQLRTAHYLPVDTCLKGPDVWGAAARVVTHLHGGHVPQSSDGYPEETFLPGQQSLPYIYPNTQEAGTLWYHDHAMGITRLNVYMGLAGFYLLRDEVEDALNLPSGAYEVGLAIQDRSFNPDGTLKYPALWQEDFYGDFIVVNGKVWPKMGVHRGLYRFRMLNGCTSRTVTLSLSNGANFSQIGTDLGLLEAPVPLPQLTLQPGERADVVIDFSPYAAGTEIILTNSAPAPFPGSPGEGVIPNVMKFVVGAQTGGPGALPAALRPRVAIPESEACRTRSFTLRKNAGTCAGSVWQINDLPWETITERPRLGTTEIWSFVNRSGMSHPMHMHLVAFRVLDRQGFDVINGQVVPVGTSAPPPAGEDGWKDTVRCDPAQITRVIARFEDYVGQYPYHCHILEHEEHEMMRQFASTCYANCDSSTVAPILNVLDFNCFLNEFAAQNPAANCDRSTIPPVLNVLDFNCFLNRFAAGCP